MATKRISDLTAVNLVSGSALLPIVQDGATVAVTFADFTGSIDGLGGAAATAVTASHAVSALTASYAISASYEISYETSSSYAETATTASYALTASSALTAELGVYSDTARTQYIGSGLTYFDAVSVDGTTGLTTLYSARVNNGFVSKAGAEITGSVDVQGSVEATSFSGSFSGSFEGDGSGLTGIVASFSQQTISADDTTIASTAVLAAGSVNIVDTATAGTDIAVRLDSPTFGSITHVVNTSGEVISVFPYDANSSIYGEPSGSAVTIPSDGLMYTFTCIQNPGIGTWSLSTPTSAGGATTQTRITLEEIFNFTTVSGSGVVNDSTLASGSIGASSTYINPANDCALTPNATPGTRVFWDPLFNSYKQIAVSYIELLSNIPTGDIVSNSTSTSAAISALSTGFSSANPLLSTGAVLAQAYKDVTSPGCSVGAYAWRTMRFDPQFDVNWVAGTTTSGNQGIFPYVSLPGDPGTTGQLYQKIVYYPDPNAAGNRQNLFDTNGYPRIYFHAVGSVGQGSGYSDRHQYLLGDGLELEFKLRVTFELYK